MSEINIKYYELQDLLKCNKFNNNLTFVSCFEEEECYDIKIKKDSNIFCILTNFNNYCYVESNTLNTNELNQQILYGKFYNNLELILESIKEFNFNNNKQKRIKYNNVYNFYNEIDEKTKVYINFEELENKSNKNSKVINTTLKAPKELLLNTKQLFKLIQSEIKKINSNYDYQHQIVPFDNSIFTLKITLFLNNNLQVNLKINLDPSLYPFLPPNIEIISPKVKLPLYFGIMNINISKLANWNSAISLEWIIVNLANKLNPIIQDYIELDTDYDDIELLLLKLSNLIKVDLSNKVNIDLDINKIPNQDQTTKNNSYWKSGTGYGSGANKDWDINKFIKETEIKKMEIINCLKNINEKMTNKNSNFIKSSCLLSYIINQISGANMLQIENDKLIFIEIIKIMSNLKCFENHCNIIDTLFVNKLINELKPINDEILLLFESNEEFQNNELYQGIHSIYQTYYDLYDQQVTQASDIVTDCQNIELKYCNIMKPLQFGMQEAPANHRFIGYKKNNPEPSALKRIISEISSFKNGLPLNFESSIWVRISKNNMNIFTFIISGPKDTPYENGLFEFHAYFPNTYPQVEPLVQIYTTGNGSVRFNPNLYACGKVCLSLLGTWSGQASEKWNPKTSTFLQVLVSIQSLILVEQPYFNEPGYERDMHTDKGKTANKAYNNNLEVQTIRLAMNEQIKNPPPGYEEVVKNHFRIKKETIINTADKWLANTDVKFKAELTKQVDELKVLLDGL
jgi:ubiquitin-protein ligase